MREENFSTYNGNKLSTKELDRLTLRHIRKKMLELEPQLMDQRWWDYRDMHPAAATLLFYHCYQQALSDYLFKYHGREVRLWAPLFSRKPGFITATWKARQAADLIGMPYEYFCSAGMIVANELGWQRVPTPAQLYSEEIYSDISARWDAARDAALCVATRLEILGAEAPDSPWKRDYQFALCKHLETKPVSLCSQISLGRMDEKVARKLLGDERVDYALSW